MTSTPRTSSASSTSHPSDPSPAARLRAVLLALLVAVAVPAAMAPAASAATQTSATSWVRGAHLVPGLGTMTLALTPVTGSTTPDLGDAVVLAPTASYGDVGDYLKVPAGRYAVGVWPAGSPRDADPVLTGTIDTADGGAYTVAGFGTKEQPTVATLTDDLTPPQGQAARIRVLPAAQSAPTVDVAAVGGPAVATGAAFGRATEYSTVPAGSWTLETTAAGEAGNDTDVALASGGVYTLLVLDTADGLGVTAVVDASGSGDVPVGGAATGGGGTAGTGLPATVPLAAGAGVLLLAVAGAAARRRSVPAVATSPLR